MPATDRTAEAVAAAAAASEATATATATADANATAVGETGAVGAIGATGAVLPVDGPSGTAAENEPLPPLPAFAAPGRVAPSLRGRVVWQQARVVAARTEAAGLRTLRLALPDWTAHVAGQHYMLRLTAADGYTAQRHYSVSSAPSDPGHVELTVDRVDGGEVSGFLHDVARVGDTLEVRGPLGGFFAWAADRPALLIGGGSGIGPLAAMLREQRASAPDVPLDLIACVRSPEHLPFHADLTADQPYSAAHVAVVYSRSAPPGGPVGRLTAAVLAPYAERALAEDREVYVCGSTGFAEAVGTMLTAAGVPPTRIRLERFGDAPDAR
ncbi:FAD-binding oxidoreductase [Yinghuangia seranimata]|uniref:FAD-binding oxidoreductase n=1 Tax=Yinghuangia seranimata TaxID=408067 RepID=UPI00248B461A|nr:FAD-binding oxidoreductase [Yinghuangia seranimata]MDI2125996.1 FAD-binding oxidoreductase [Yinghuangia seranimata]